MTAPLQVTPVEQGYVEPRKKGSAIRQQRYKQRLAEQGLTIITVAVPAGEAASDMKILAARLCADRDMVVGNPKSRKTGRMIRL